MTRSAITKHGRDHRPDGHDPIPGLGGGGSVEFLDLWSKGEDTQVFASGSTKLLHFNNASSTSSSWYSLLYSGSAAVSPPYDEVYIDPGRYHIIAWANMIPLKTSDGSLLAQWFALQLNSNNTITFPQPQWQALVDVRNFNSLPLSGPGNPDNVGYFKLAKGMTFTDVDPGNQGDISMQAFRENTVTSLTWNNYCGLTIAKLA